MARLFRKILVPHDFSTTATQALRVAVDLAGAQRGSVAVLHVIVPFTPVTTFPPVEGMVWLPPANLVSTERQRLEALVKKTVGRRTVRVRAQVVVGDPYQRIIDASRGADSIVMATTGRTGLSHLLIGSVAEKVVRHATVPVLTLRPEAGRKARGAGRGRRRARTTPRRRSA